MTVQAILPDEAQWQTQMRLTLIYCIRIKRAATFYLPCWPVRLMFGHSIKTGQSTCNASSFNLKIILQRKKCFYFKVFVLEGEKSAEVFFIVGVSNTASKISSLVCVRSKHSCKNSNWTKAPGLSAVINADYHSSCIH